MKKADMVVDLQYGSTGKGLIAGYLAVKEKYDVIVTANMPNAGHTFIDSRGNKMIHKVLPNGVVSPRCKYVLIGPGAVFSPSQLDKEVRLLISMGYTNFDVCIHPNAVILTDDHTEAEQKYLRIGSTAQGSAAAVIQKMHRDPENNPTAGASGHEVEDTYYGGGGIVKINIIDHNTYYEIISTANKILLEGAQGFSLGINERFYPYCTSRDCTPARFMADMGMPLPYLDRVIGTARMHPIRVGSPPTGYSGDCYPDQVELNWEDLKVESERTTVTNRIRRVFSFSNNQIINAIQNVAPTDVFLNFCNYSNNIAVKETINNINMLCDTIYPGESVGVSWTGWGATVNDIKEQ